jgi:hypothetical protein
MSAQTRRLDASLLPFPQRRVSLSLASASVLRLGGVRYVDTAVHRRRGPLGLAAATCCVDGHHSNQPTAWLIDQTLDYCTYLVVADG